jgi:hypothetical protein
VFVAIEDMVMGAGRVDNATGVVSIAHVSGNRAVLA